MPSTVMLARTLMRQIFLVPEKGSTLRLPWVGYLRARRDNACDQKFAIRLEIRNEPSMEDVGVRYVCVRRRRWASRPFCLTRSRQNRAICGRGQIVGGTSGL